MRKCGEVRTTGGGGGGGGGDGDWCAASLVLRRRGRLGDRPGLGWDVRGLLRPRSWLPPLPLRLDFVSLSLPVAALVAAAAASATAVAEEEAAPLMLCELMLERSVWLRLRLRPRAERVELLLEGLPLREERDVGLPRRAEALPLLKEVGFLDGRRDRPSMPYESECDWLLRGPTLLKERRRVRLLLLLAVAAPDAPPVSTSSSTTAQVRQ